MPPSPPWLTRLAASDLAVAVCITGASLLLFLLAFVACTALIGAPPTGWTWTVCMWDCAHYRSIAMDGYPTVPPAATLQAHYGFFPAFPVLVAGMMRLSGASFTVAGVALNALLAVGFSFLALRYRRELGLERRPTILFALAFLLSPWSLYNHIPYTEMLFNLCALGTFVTWRRGQYAASAAFGFVLTATRVSGVMMPVVLAMALLIAERRSLLRVILRPDMRFRALAIMPLGLFAFMAYLYWAIGDPRAYFHAQEFGWNQGLRNPFAVISSAFFAPPAERYNGYGFVLYTLLILLGIVRGAIPGSLAAFGWITPAFATASVITSQARYGLALFPVYLVFASLTGTARAAVLILFAAGQCVFLFFWLIGQNALI